MEKILQKVLKEITPTEEEGKCERKIVKKIFQELKKFKEVEPLLVGSLAKKTDIRTHKDIDIFIKFHPDVPREELEKKGLDFAKDVFQKLKAEYEIDYAEHPYVIGYYQDYTIEIVPYYDIKGKCQSAVDRTPFHTLYVQKKLKERPALRANIRLLKQFMQGIKVYGAEAKIQGFSGYLTELLVINYGSFQKVLESARDWKFPHILDPENLWRRSDKNSLKYFFSGADLVMVDPVDKDRNVAAAISGYRLSQFVVAARKFLKEPHFNFFFPPSKKPPSKEELEERISLRGTKLIAILFSHPKINPNTLYSQLRKTKKSISQLIHDKKFQILKSDEWSNEVSKSILIFEFGVWSLPRAEYWLGPPVDTPNSEQEKFLKKYKHAYVNGKRWVADRERKFKTPEPLIKKILMEKTGFGKNLKQVKVELLSHQEIINKLSSEKDFLIFLGDFLKHL